MTTANASPPLAAGDALIAAEPSSTRLARFEAALERAGEWLNPILVKECRQALKSRQFVITFSLLLLCGWLWSIVGVAMIGPDIYFSFDGPDMFYGYYMILAFPLFVIVPYCAFRSLAGEREDRTFELVSITTLKPRQIVGGKLGSAVIQMMVYFSAISPCLAFTYMLRGIDVLTIAMILVYTFAASLALSVLSLLIATLTAEKHWQVVLSVVLILGLAYLFIMACVAAHELLSWSRPSFDDADFWYAHAAMLTAYIAYFVLFYLTAGAQLTFSSDNRSTPLRVVMLAQFLIFTGWMAWAAFHYGNAFQSREVGAFLLMYLIFSGLHWYLMGTFMVGEWPYLSPRVKRQLPQSFLGRVFLTWFNPGPGTGYLFALGNLLAALVLSLLAAGVWNSIAGLMMPGRSFLEVITYFALIGYCYIVIYLGIGKLLVSVGQRLAPVGIVLTLLIQVLLLLAGCGIPLVIHLMSDMRDNGYSMLHITNPVWTLVELFDNTTGPVYGPMALTFLAPAALLVFLANLPSIVAEVRHVRIAQPKRVAEEDATLAAELAPPVPVRSSPWD